VAKVKVPREAIIEAAFEIATESGIDAVTAITIAKRLNCSKQPVYWAFESIENLRSAIREKAIIKYTQYFETHIPNEPPSKAATLNYIRFAKDCPHLFHLVFCTNRQEHIGIYDSRLGIYRQRVIKMIQEEYSFDEARATDLYINVLIYIHGIASMLISNAVEFSDAEINNLISQLAHNMTRD
jgi:AcrR family transcriptional regulator